MMIQPRPARQIVRFVLLLALLPCAVLGCRAAAPTAAPTLLAMPTATPTEVPPTPTPTKGPPTATPVPTNTPPAVEGLQVPEPAPPEFQKGMSYATWWRDNYSSPESDQALAILPEATGSEWLALIVTCYQETMTSTEITCELPRTPTDGDLLHALGTARELGLKVMLKPHLDLNSDPGYWRGDIGKGFTQEDEWAAWFVAYEAMIVHYAGWAEAQQVEQFCVGTELSGTTAREAEWRAVIDAVREAYSGPLVYASNHGAELSVAWWDALDFIGVDAYYAMTASKSPSLDDLKAIWRTRVNRLKTLSQRADRPVVITEIGYRSVDGANIQPWAYATGGEVDLHEQAICYRAALESLWGQPWLAGIYWWNWDTDPNQGGPQNIGYTPHGKPAEAILRLYYDPSTTHLPVVEKP